MEIYVIKQAFYEKNKAIVKQELNWKNLYGERTESEAKNEVQKLEIESIKENINNSFRFTYDYEKINVF